MNLIESFYSIKWNKYSVLSILFFVSVFTFAQGTQDVALVKKARANWGNLNLKISESLYKDAIDLNQENFDANFELGIFMLEVHDNYASSLRYLNRALELMPKDTVYEVYKFLGESNHYLGEYAKAKSFYQRFKPAIIKDEELKSQIELRIAQCDFAMSFNEVLWDGKFVNMGDQVNSESSEYCSVLPQKDSFLLFTKRSTESLNGKDAIISMEDIFFSKQKNKVYHASDRSTELSEFRNLSGDKKFHNAVVSISPSGDTMMIYRKNLLWSSTLVGSEWSLPVKMPKTINLGRNQRHATFTPDGKQMYFSSNAKNGVGGFDLYTSKIDSAGNWSEAKNLGAVLNTIGDEDSPFITADGKRLYFSSKGHLGYGKYDVFYSDWQDTAWSKPINAGKPINSPADDIYFHVMNNEMETSLISSSRNGGFGQMDIYYFYKYGESKFEDCQFQLVTAMEDDSISGLEDYLLIAGLDTVFTNQSYDFTPDTFCVPDSVTNVFWKMDTIVEEKHNLSLTFDSTQLENQLITLELLTRDADNEEHRYCVSKNVYVKPEVIIIPEKQRTFKDSNEVALSIGSKLKEEDILALPEGFDLAFESVYFSFNKYDIRKDQRSKMDANIKTIKENPNIIIKIIGYTDKVGSKDYNTKLSQKRAKSAVKYLTKKGVSINQIVAVLSSGEDEEGVRYKNEDGSDDVEKMEVSRRVDFYVIGKSK